MKNQPVYVNGQRVVRIRERWPNIGPFRVRMFIVTDLHGRKSLGINHLNYEAASRWVSKQGWRHMGPQT